jgi:hypothetical protein
MRAVLLEMDDLDYFTQEERVALIAKANAIAVKYSEGAAAISCQVYDDVAEMSGKDVPAAEPAEMPKMKETATAVNGTLNIGNVDVIARSVSRQVRVTGMDTIVKNAIRDRAEYAWIPQGKETCAFCITLASRGWLPASEAALKGGHVDHIHPNCDCLYAVRFNKDTSYADYDPNKYKRIYDSADGSTWRQKVNSIRREL